MYVEGNSIVLATMPKSTECKDCGDARREIEEEKKQARREALLKRFGTED